MEWIAMKLAKTSTKVCWYQRGLYFDAHGTKAICSVLVIFYLFWKQKLAKDLTISWFSCFDIFVVHKWSERNNVSSTEFRFLVNFLLCNYLRQNERTKARHNLYWRFMRHLRRKFTAFMTRARLTFLKWVNFEDEDLRLNLPIWKYILVVVFVILTCGPTLAYFTLFLLFSNNIDQKHHLLPKTVAS